MNSNSIKAVLSELRDPIKKTWILLSPSSMGETLLLCSLSEAFIKKHGHSITLVIPKSHEFITRCYPNLFHKIFFMSVEEMRLFCSFNIVPRNFFELDFPINTWSDQINDSSPIALFELFVKTLGAKGLNLVDLYRYNLRIGWDAPCKLPTLPVDICDLTAKKLIQEFKINEKFILIQGGNNTNHPIPAIYLNNICKKLKGLDIDIIFNTLGATFSTDIEVLDHIKFLKLSVIEVTSLSKLALTIISGTNGLSTLLSALELNKTIHIFLPNLKLMDSENLIFEKINPQAYSPLLGTPELIHNSNHILEYQVDEEPNELMCNDVVDSVLNSIT